jgi:tRNA(Arg) A34 adenosine deaminase TadA
MKLPSVTIEYPAWLSSLVDWERCFKTDRVKMELAIELSRRNVTEGTGGPFGAAVFARDTGRLMGVGANLVVAQRCSVLHGEVLALMMAHERVGHYSLKTEHGLGYELVTSCEPCAMCLGAVHWSGVSRLLCGATREDAQEMDFDEGPVFDASYRYLEERGLEVVRGVCREDAAAVLALYRANGGIVYNH